MSYAGNEASIAGGRPVSLYLFERGAFRWSYCDADRDQTLQSRTWQAIAISDDGRRQTGEASADTLTVTLPGSLAVPQLYRGAPPSAEVWLTVRAYHYGDDDTLANTPVVWVGTVTSVSWPEVDRAEVACQPLSASMDRVGLRLTYMRSCPHALYDVNCGVNRDQFKVAATVSVLTGSAIEYSSAAMLPDGRAAGGYIEWSIGSGELERRSILAHSGSTLTLLGGTDGLSAGRAITVYPGCRQTTSDCNSYYNNIVNFGGFPAMPGTSPFDGNPVF